VILERDFQQQVTDLAELLGWSWAHFRPAQTAHGWRTAVSGPLGKGFPDLVLAHPRKVCVLFAELKAREKGQVAKLSVDQQCVHDVLRMAGARVVIWTPADWDTIVNVLSDA
jgi:hypothetical protein